MGGGRGGGRRGGRGRREGITHHSSLQCKQRYIPGQCSASHRAYAVHCCNDTIQWHLLY